MTFILSHGKILMACSDSHGSIMALENYPMVFYSSLSFTSPCHGSHPLLSSPRLWLAYPHDSDSTRILSTNIPWLRLRLRLCHGF
jgi:hypothetical protein